MLKKKALFYTKVVFNHESELRIVLLQMINANLIKEIFPTLMNDPELFPFVFDQLATRTQAPEAEGSEGLNIPKSCHY